MGWCVLPMILLLVVPMRARQLIEPSLATASGDSLRSASVEFDKSISTYRWLGQLGYSQVIGPLSFSVSERFLSTLLRADRNLITDEQSINLRARYKATNVFSPSTRISSFILSDDKTIGISSASAHGVYGGIAITPESYILIEPLLGIRFDNQIDKHDRGASYMLNLEVEEARFSGYRLDAVGKYQYDRLDPRAIELRNLQVSIERQFFERTRNRLNLNYYRNRRDFYFLADGSVLQQFGVTHNIETRSEDAFGAGDTLDYQLGKGALLTMQGNLFTRRITRETYLRYSGDPRINTGIDELRIEGGMQAQFSPSQTVNTLLRFFYQEREERHIVRDEDAFDRLKNIDSLSLLAEMRNNHSRRTTLSGEGVFSPSRSDTFSITGSGTILRYDTPSAVNVEDRDELWYLISATAAHRFSRSLHLSLAADVQLTHLVYLSSKRSDQNTWNRIFRLSPRVSYQPSAHLTSVNRFEVLANYTAYDFEFLTSNTRSFVFRQLSFTDSTLYNITRRVALEWTNTIRVYERGDLKWDEFTQRLVNSFLDRSYLATVHYSLNDCLLFSIGIRYFNQLRYGYRNSERYVEQQFESLGPTTRISWSSGSRTIFSIRGWYEHQTQTGVAGRNFANMTMSLNVSI